MAIIRHRFPTQNWSNRQGGGKPAMPTSLRLPRPKRRIGLRWMTSRTNRSGERMTRSHIGIVGRLGHFLLDDMEEALSHLGHIVTRYEYPGALDTNGPELDALIAGSGFHCSREFVASSPHLRGVVSPVTGIEWIDLSAATDLGIVVANGQTPENTES